QPLSATVRYSLGKRYSGSSTTRVAKWKPAFASVFLLFAVIPGGPAGGTRILDPRCDVSNGFVEMAIMHHSKVPRVGATRRQVLSNRDFSLSNWPGLRDGVYFVSGYPKVNSGLATWAA